MPLRLAVRAQLEIALLGLDDHQLVAQRILALRDVGELGVLRQRGAPVGQLGEPGVQVLDVEQTLLVGAGCFQGELLWSARRVAPRRLRRTSTGR